MKTIRLDGLRVERRHRTDVEGSRGGKVIGHTSSGKPIYQSKKGQGTKDFTAKEHEEAADHHRKRAEHHAWSKEERPATSPGDALGKIQSAHDHHTEQAEHHSKMAQRKKSGMK